MPSAAPPARPICPVICNPCCCWQLILLRGWKRGTTFRYCIIFGNAGRSDTLISLEWLFLRHIRKIDELTSVRERDPRISHACKIFTLFRVVCFLRKHRALSGCFPCRVAFGSHLIFPCGAPARSQCYDHGLYSGTHLFVVEVNLSRAIFYRRLAFPDLRARRLRQVVLNYPYGSTKTRAPHCRHHIHGARRISNSLPCDKALLGCAHQNLQHPPGGGDAMERIGADPNNT